MNRILLGLITTLALATTATHGKELDWPTTPYSHFSDQEPLRDVLQSLASNQGITAVISERVTDVISVSFTEMAPVDIFERLVKAYNLIWYFDGNALYLYRHDEVETSTLKLKTLTVTEFRQTLEELGIFDQRFSWSAAESKGIVYFSGPQRFVSLVTEMAERMDVTSEPPSNVVYTWLDEYGVINYSSEPPAQKQENLRTLKVKQAAVDGKAPTLELDTTENQQDARQPAPRTNGDRG